MLKSEARKTHKELRTLSTEKNREDWSIAIANNLLKLPIWEKLYYHLFLPIEKLKEVDTEHIINILFAKNKEIVISKSNFENLSMVHFLLTENTRIVKNEYDIPEPVDGIEVPVKKIDIVFVPLLAFDKNGNRVGYGKGFYDRFLVNTNAIKIGLSFFEATEALHDISSDDVALDFCVTPKKIYNFSSK
ncbi:MAG: 5-formyltetrahydrofolate cyclo-ligase [Flavicella sp.]